MKTIFRLLSILLVLSCLSASGAKRRPNIILMMADDCGYEALACNGSTTYKTPTFDRIAAQGMRFTRTYSQPVCTPSRVKIMTGQSNARNYVSFGNLRKGEITFGNVLKAVGYRTCIAGKWQLSGNSGKGTKGMWWDECGFDESCMWAYAHYLKPKDLDHYVSVRPLKKGKATSRFWQPGILENGNYRPTTTDDFGPDIYTDFILDFIERNKDEEFFVYYPMALTHSPFIPTPHSKDITERGKFSSNKKYFGDMVRYSGYLMEKIIKKLESAGIADETLVIFTCDNGTGRGMESWMGDRLVVGAKAFPIDAGTHVPMIAYWPGTIKPGTVCNDLVEFTDFMTTFASIADGELPQDRVLDGRSFLPQMRGQKGNPRDSIVIHFDKDPKSIKPKFRRVRFAYDGRYKLYLDGRMIEVANDWLEQSPLEMKMVSSEAKRARRRLQATLDRYPEWKPDNSFFGDKPSKDFAKHLMLHEKLESR